VFCELANPAGQVVHVVRRDGGNLPICSNPI